MMVRFASAADLVTICGNLRPADAAELVASNFESDPVEIGLRLASGLDNAVLRLTLAANDGDAVAFIGFWLIAPGVGSAMMVATPRFREIAVAAHRFCKQTVMDKSCGSTFRRVECRAMAAHTLSRAWLARLGFAEEGILRRVGRGGEDFVQMAWLNPKEV